MTSNCEKCELPGISRRIELYKNSALTANANIMLSSYPTEAEPYKKKATEEIEELRIANKEYEDFIKIWSGFCSKCNFGA